MTDTNKHNFNTCPSCGANVCRTDDTCWSCHIELEELYKRIHHKDRLKNLKRGEKKRLRHKTNPDYKESERFKDVLPVFIWSVILIIVVAGFIKAYYNAYP